ncbi:hypothetical protein L3Q82_012268 [Scortum barcoo]|uniref:Uncharacterized protein n=1 Tax=Scortum barcoo TaxID=214431 RepID=A0ACB8W3H2_9TELE|nr:hypothetical protein L3Q82_012268 [Scortum barcoo]
MWWSAAQVPPRGTVLSPFLFTLYTLDFTYSTDSCHLQKFSDDTAIVGCVSEGNDCAYRKVIMDFVKTFHGCKRIRSEKVPPRLELGSLDSESRVLTITPWNPESISRKDKLANPKQVKTFEFDEDLIQNKGIFPNDLDTEIKRALGTFYCQEHSTGARGLGARRFHRDLNSDHWIQRVQSADHYTMEPGEHKQEGQTGCKRIRSEKVPPRLRTRITGFRVQSADHYTMEPGEHKQKGQTGLLNSMSANTFGHGPVVYTREQLLALASQPGSANPQGETGDPHARLRRRKRGCRAGVKCHANRDDGTNLPSISYHGKCEVSAEQDGRASGADEAAAPWTHPCEGEYLRLVYTPVVKRQPPNKRTCEALI